MTLGLIVIGLIASVAILAAIPRLPNAATKGAAGVAAALVFFVFFTLSSVRYVGPDEVGVIVKNIGASSLPEGKIIATEGEKGPQARVLAPGWHPWLWPGVFTVESPQIVEVGENEVGLVKAQDGRPLPEGEAFAPAMPEDEFSELVQDARAFLTEGGYKGPQTNVLKPGKYRLNPRLFDVEKVPVTNVPKATVAVIKSNVGPQTTIEGSERLVPQGARGIWIGPILPSKQYLNTNAYEVTIVSTELNTVRYTKAAGARPGSEVDRREITVRSSDGFTFPVDVRIEYQINPDDAPLVVANFGDDGPRLTERLNSVVRSVFRNNAEGVKALDYVRQRSQQESQSLAMISNQMSDFGVAVTGVRIGDVGDEQTLGPLLETQTDREIAVQEQITFQEQQRAAEQRKALTRTQQEAEEEKRLATAQYEVKIAEEQKQQRIIAAQAQAEAIRVEADAQAAAFEMIARQIGPGNSALIEMLKIVGERGVQITPRVMVVGDADGAGSGDAETTALIGTMLDSMMRQNGPPPARAERTGSSGGGGG